VRERRDLPLYHTLRYRPNPFCTATRFWGTVETHRNHYGNAYVWLQPVGDSYHLWHLPSPQVRVWWDNAKILADQPYIWYIWSAPNGVQYAFSSDEIIHVRTWLSLDGIIGLPVQQILTLTLEGAQKSQQMLNGLYDSGFTAKAVVQYTGDLSDQLTQEFVRRIERYAKGDVEEGKNIIPIPLGTKLEPLNIKLTDGQFLELRKYTALQVAAAFGIKPDQINDYTKSSYSSSEAQQLAFLVDTQLYILKDYEEEIGHKVLTDEQRQKQSIYPKFNTAVVLRADTETQIRTLCTAVAGNLYTPDEARAFLDMGHKPGGDRLYANGNLIPLEDAGKQYERG
jgi:HK97 family phage portal protein